VNVVSQSTFFELEVDPRLTVKYKTSANLKS